MSGCCGEKCVVEVGVCAGCADPLVVRLEQAMDPSPNPNPNPNSRQHRHWMPALDALSLLISRRLLDLNSLFCIYLSITLTLTLTLQLHEK